MPLLGILQEAPYSKVGYARLINDAVLCILQEALMYDKSIAKVNINGYDKFRFVSLSMQHGQNCYDICVEFALSVPNLE